jgi:hypothetical protein
VSFFSHLVQIYLSARAQNFDALIIAAIMAMALCHSANKKRSRQLAQAHFG